MRIQPAPDTFHLNLEASYISETDFVRLEMDWARISKNHPLKRVCRSELVGHVLGGITLTRDMVGTGDPKELVALVDFIDLILPNASYWDISRHETTFIPEEQLLCLKGSLGIAPYVRLPPQESRFQQKSFEVIVSPHGGRLSFDVLASVDFRVGNMIVTPEMFAAAAWRSAVEPHHFKASFWDLLPVMFPRVPHKLLHCYEQVYVLRRDVQDVFGFFSRLHQRTPPLTSSASENSLHMREYKQMCAENKAYFELLGGVVLDYATFVAIDKESFGRVNYFSVLRFIYPNIAPVILNLYLHTYNSTVSKGVKTVQLERPGALAPSLPPPPVAAQTQKKKPKGRRQQQQQLSGSALLGGAAALGATTSSSSVNTSKPKPKGKTEASTTADQTSSSNTIGKDESSVVRLASGKYVFGSSHRHAGLDADDVDSDDTSDRQSLVPVVAVELSSVSRAGRGAQRNRNPQAAPPPPPPPPGLQKEDSVTHLALNQRSGVFLAKQSADLREERRQRALDMKHRQDAVNQPRRSQTQQGREGTGHGDASRAEARQLPPSRENGASGRPKEEGNSKFTRSKKQQPGANNLLSGENGGTGRGSRPTSATLARPFTSPHPNDSLVTDGAPPEPLSCRASPVPSVEKVAEDSVESLPMISFSQQSLIPLLFSRNGKRLATKISRIDMSVWSSVTKEPFSKHSKESLKEKPWRARDPFWDIDGEGKAPELPMLHDNEKRGPDRRGKGKRRNQGGKKKRRVQPATAVPAAGEVTTLASFATAHSGNSKSMSDATETFLGTRGQSKKKMLESEVDQIVGHFGFSHRGGRGGSTNDRQGSPVGAATPTSTPPSRTVSPSAVLRREPLDDNLANFMQSGGPRPPAVGRLNATDAPAKTPVGLPKPSKTPSSMYRPPKTPEKTSVTPFSGRRQNM